MTVEESSGCVDMGDMMEEAEVEEEGEGSEEEVEGEVGEEMEVGDGGDDEDYEREVPPPSDLLRHRRL